MLSVPAQTAIESPSEISILTERDLDFGEVVPSPMRDIVRDQQFAPRFDALVVDEAQDHDTCWPGSEIDNSHSGWWEIYWKLLREGTNARMAIFYDRAQRPIFRQKERFEGTHVLKRDKYAGS